MSLSRSASSSSAGSDGVSSVNSSKSGGAIRPGAAEKDDGVDILEQGQSMETALFGVLYTMAKEKFDSSSRLAVLKIILDFIQFFLLVVRPSYGWDIDQSSWLWKAISWVTFVDPLLQKGYDFYIGVQLTIAALLLLSILLCIWVGYCFKNDHFPYLWPIQILRVVVATFVVVFYIASLSIFMVALNCNWFVAGPTKFHVHAYPDVACFTSPHIIYFAISLIAAVTFILIAFCMTIADFDLNPLTKRLLSSPQTLVEVRNLFARTLMVVVASQLYGQPNLQSIIFFLLTFFLFWSFVRWQPNYNPWVNHVRSGLYAVLTWASILLVALSNGDSSGQASYRRMVTAVMAYGILPLFVLGCASSLLRLHLLKRALKKFEAGEPPKDQIRDVYRFNNPSEAEILSRCCRRYLPEDDEVLDPNAVKTGELVVRVGMALFPQDFFMVLTYSSFLLEVEHNWQSGASQLQQARKFALTLSDKFAIFVREQEQKQRSQTQNSGESGTDLVSYVEFQRNTALVTRYHSAALHNIKNFWKLLLHNEVSFSELVGCFGEIESSKAKCERAYKMILDRYPSSVKLMRSYVQFLEEVNNDPWSANKYSKLADKVEEDQESADNNDMLLSDSSGIGMNAKNSGVCCINATGTIEMVNKQLLKIFGYKKGELEGKNVSVLMPPPFSQRHNNFLKSYISTGKAKIIDSVRDVVGVHKERQLIPMKILVSKVSGSGIDSIFMGLLQPNEEDPDVVKVLMMPQGIVIVVDERFYDWFGKGPAECTGKHVSSLVSEQDTITRLLDTSQTANEEEFKGGSIAASVHILHKFVAPVRVNIQFDLGGTESQRLLIMQIRKIHKGEDSMMVADQKGRVVFINQSLRKMLDLKPKQVQKLDLSKVMPPPFSVLHQRWVKDMTPKVPLQSCRKSATVLIRDTKGALLPVRPLIGPCGSVENPLYSIHLEKSSWEQGTDERRMSLELDEEGRVQSALGSTPDSLFGFEPSSLLGTTLEAFVNVFADLVSASTKPKNVVIADFFSRMITRASERPGYSWRVGVHPVSHIDENATSMGKMIAQAVLARNTKAALMQLEVREPEAEGEIRVLKLHLWRADMVTGIVEIDHNTAITNPLLSPIHPSGLFFGHPDKKLRRQRLCNLLHLPGSHGEDLLKDLKKHKGGAQAKGAMKSGTTGRKVGPSMVVTGRHMDGGEIKVRIQAVAKDSKHISVKINFEEIHRGSPEIFKSTLFTEEELRLEAEKKGALIALMRGEGDELSDQSSDEAGGGRSKSFMSALEEEEEEEEEEELDPALAKGSVEEAAVDVVDFKRAVRYRKLCALLSSRAARLDLLRYLTHMRMILVLLLVVHTACFIAIIVSIESLNSYINMIENCAKSSYMLQRVMIYARMLSNIHLNNINPTWYSAANLTNIAYDFKADIYELETAHQAIFFGTDSKPSRLPNDFSLNAIWENSEVFPETHFFDIASPFYLTDANSLWDIMNGVIVHAREVLQNHAYISEITNGNITNHHDWQFVLTNGVESGTVGYRQSTDGVTSVTMDKVDQIYTVAIALLIVEGVFFCVGAAVWSLWMFLAVLKRRYTLFSVFFVVPSALLKSLATKKLSVDDEDDDDVDEDQATEGEATPVAGISAVKAGASVKTHKGGKPPGANAPLTLRSRLKSLWAAFKGGLFGSQVEVGKKMMKQDSKDTYLLTLPLIFWGMLIISVYAYSYVTLKAAGVPLINMNVAGRVLVKSARAIFAAHELISQETDAQKTAYKALLLARRDDLYSYYEGLLYGSESLSGLSFSPVPSTLFESTSKPAYLFFKGRQCYEDKYSSRYCYVNASESYYEVSNHALDPMIIRLMDELFLLANDSPADINVNSTRMDYVWNVGYHSTVKGLYSSELFFSDKAVSYFKQVEIANIVLFSMSWVLAAIFYFGIISPFVIRVGRESVQVAELLSQLPRDLDAEGLVKSMMVEQGKKKEDTLTSSERRSSALNLFAPRAIASLRPSPLPNGKRASIDFSGPPLSADLGIGKKGARRVSVELTAHQQ